MITAALWSPTGPARSDLPGQGGTLRHINIKAGHVAQRHHHDFEQFLYVVSGNAILQCEQGEIALEPGVALHLAAGSWHSAEFTADTILIEMNLT